MADSPIPRLDLTYESPYSYADEDAPAVPGITRAELDDLERLRYMSNEDEVTFSKRIFKQNAIGATLSLVRLATQSLNEQTRLKASQAVLDRALGRVQDSPPEDPTDPYHDLLFDKVIDTNLRTNTEAAYSEQTSHATSDTNSGDIDATDNDGLFATYPTADGGSVSVGSPKVAGGESLRQTHKRARKVEHMALSDEEVGIVEATNNDLTLFENDAVDTDGSE